MFELCASRSPPVLYGSHRQPETLQVQDSQVPFWVWHIERLSSARYEGLLVTACPAHVGSACWKVGVG